MPWIRKLTLDAFDIPIEDRVVRIRLSDGSVEYEDPDGETYGDGWSTVEDLAWGLGEYAKVPSDQARIVAEEAVRRWREHLGPDHRFRYFCEG